MSEYFRKNGKWIRGGMVDVYGNEGQIHPLEAYCAEITPLENDDNVDKTFDEWVGMINSALGVVLDWHEKRRLFELYACPLNRCIIDRLHNNKKLDYWAICDSVRHDSWIKEHCMHHAIDLYFGKNLKWNEITDWFWHSENYVKYNFTETIAIPYAESIGAE